ncbi:hypothetical protein [Ruegeria arenilitoris]|uniref:hypothetical protein n=1 Tax=Ruegeria arenilitoris TaxID=1173585 RepID=UPI0014808712|nr:hypothetical protein [Ruegeria arenilitoris]
MTVKPIYDQETSKMQTLTKAKDEAMAELLEYDKHLLALEVELDTAHANAKVAPIKVEDIGEAAAQRAEVLARVTVLEDMLKDARTERERLRMNLEDCMRAIANQEFDTAQAAVEHGMRVLEPMLKEVHEIVREMASYYWGVLEKQGMRQHQSVFDQMLWDYFTLTQRGENYTGSANHRNLKTYEATQEWYAGKFGAEYGRKVHVHQSLNNKWPLADRNSELFQKGMKAYLNQKEKRAASKAKRSA